MRVSKRVQVDSTKSLRPGSYVSSLTLENVLVTSGIFRGALSPSSVSKASRGRGRKWGDCGKVGDPGTGEALPASYDIGDGLGVGTTF